MISGPIYLVWDDQAQGLIGQDSINELLCEVGKVRSDEKIELDLSSLPIVRAKERARARPTKQRR